MGLLLGPLLCPWGSLADFTFSISAFSVPLSPDSLQTVNPAQMRFRGLLSGSLVDCVWTTQHTFAIHPAMWL